MKQELLPTEEPPVTPRPVRDAGERSVGWNVVLFALTVLSVFAAGRSSVIAAGLVPEESAQLLDGWPFALPFLLIFVFHEFGHWILARLHQVPASLPYFIPVPFLSWFGTFGAVIVMPERIRSRNALLDIGAAGPLAGMLVAIPTMVIGLKLSVVGPQLTEGYIQEGQGLLYLLVKRLVLGPIPDGQDVQLHPTAFAAWGGFLITMINLVPWGQLDGGHVAYALFGERQNRFARWVHAALPVLFIYNMLQFSLPSWRRGMPLDFAEVFGNSTFWLFWFVLLVVMGRLHGGSHPPFEPGELSPGRRRVAWLTLALFALLFMPTPYALH
jgi:membrane-associated protease RseP (regulator of RpoE activity)